MSQITHKLKSIGFDVECDPKRIDDEIKQMGVIKFLKLASYKKDIDSLINLYVCDMRISRFFWRHIRRLEVNAKAVLINFFFEEGENIEFIGNKIMDPENEGKLIIQSKKINKEFAKKYLRFAGDESKSDNKTIKMVNHLIYIYLIKNSSKDIVSFLRTISLGSFIDLISLIDPDKVKVHSELNKYFKLKHLVGLRNNVSHFHLLCEYYNADKLIYFWKLIVDISEITQKTDKNNNEFSEYIKNFDI